MAKILVVDDRPTNRQLLLTLLGYSGHRLFEAADGADALDLVRAEHPDLVITDILMPTMDGYEFVQELRADPEISRTEVIFYTATYSTPEARLMAKACNVERVLPKPSDPQEILAAVSAALGEPGPDRAALAASAPQASAPAGGLGVERKPIPPLSERFAGGFLDLERIASRLSGLLELTLDMMSERNPQGMVEEFFGIACKIVRSDYAAVGMLDEEEKTFVCLFAKGADPGLYNRGYDRRTQAGLPYSLLGERHVLRLGAEALASLPPGHPTIESFLGCPVALAGRARGWIYFANKPGERSFSDEDERLVATEADMLASLYEHVMLYDTIQRHAARLQIEMSERKRAEAEIRRLKDNLERQVKERTADLEAANRELEAFSYSVSHDLRAPLRHVEGFARMLLETAGNLDERSGGHLNNIAKAARQMSEMIEALLGLSQVSRAGLKRQQVDMAKLVGEVLRELPAPPSGPSVRWKIDELPVVRGDPTLLRQVWTNLISNALKYSSKRTDPVVEIGAQMGADGKPVFFVRDNGVGFDMKYANKLFKVFQRLHRKDEFEGTGIGLATVRRVMERHGGRAWAEGKINEGATFYFSIAGEQANVSGM
jgi:signal transduction histidine kinase/DNA-binding NarL/FixJ family response regulator